MSRSPLAVVFALVTLALLSIAALPAGAAAADPPPPVASCINGYGTPPIAHPGRTRWIYMNCSAPSFPATYPTAVTVDQPAHGTLVQGTTLSYLYTPEAGFAGTDHFTLHPTGADGTWPAVGYQVTVSSTLDTAPECSMGANTLDVRTGESRPVSFGGCYDDNGDPITFVVADTPAHGTLGSVQRVSDSSAQATYTPAAGYVGADGMTYVAKDDLGQVSSLQPVSIIVHEATFNRAPQCGVPPPGWPGNVAVHGTTRVSWGCSDRDNDPLTILVTKPPAHGIVSVDPQTHAFVYAADPDYTGADSWDFTVSDGHEGSSAQTRAVDVVPGHDPICHDLLLDVAARTAGGDATTAALPCADDDHDQILPEILTPPAHGTLTLDLPHQQLSYTPPIGFSGTDTATYRATDDHGGADGTLHTLTFRVAGGAGTADTGTPDRSPSEEPAQQERPSAPPTPQTPADPAAPPGHGAIVATAVTPAQQAAKLLGTRGTPFGLGFGAAVQGFMAVGGAHAGRPAAAVYCQVACTVRVDGHLAFGGGHTAARAAGRTLARRTLRLKAGQVGAVKLVLSAKQRARLSRARRASVVLTLTTAVGRLKRTTHRTMKLTR
jgi:hypothetical protein